jgi:pimeloyl-ACP methyl ester carboxylesterase
MARERRVTEPDSAQAYAEAARSLVRALIGPAGRAAARQVRAPMLVVHGRQDRLVNLRASERLVRGHPERTLSVIDDCGHIPMVEVPERFLAAVLPWLEERRSSAA